MMRGTALCTTIVFLCLSPRARAETPSSAKEALQALNDYIGSWKGDGSPLKPRPATNELWKESLSWGWRFKGDDAWLTVTFQGGKYFKSGELRYLPAKKRYQLTLTDSADKKQVFEGELKNDALVLERPDADKKQTDQMTMNLAAEGVRLIYRVRHRPDGKTIYINDYEVACTREGESLGTKEKKTECVVSGGLGTIPVSYKGENYFVCCTGCWDAFNENPEKYIKEFKARKKK